MIRCLVVYQYVKLYDRYSKKTNDRDISVCFLPVVQEDDFVARDDFEDADQLRIGNDGIFMLTFFSKNSLSVSTELVFTFLFNLLSPDTSL